MILVVSVSEDPTLTYVTRHLDDLNVKWVRIDSGDLLNESRLNWTLDSSSSNVIISTKAISFSADEIESVWYRRPQKPSPAEYLSRESQSFSVGEASMLISELWHYLSNCLWVGTPFHDSSHKLKQLQLASKIGFTIPKSLVTTDPHVAKSFYKKCHGKIIFKPMGKSTIPDRVLYTSRVEKEELLDLVRYCPTYLQEEIIKSYELRVTVVGDKSFSAKINSQDSDRTKLDWRYYHDGVVTFSRHNIPSDIHDMCIQFVKAQGLNYGAIDIAVTEDNEYVFFENNPNGQFGWIEDETNYPIGKEIADLLTRYIKH